MQKRSVRYRFPYSTHVPVDQVQIRYARKHQLLEKPVPDPEEPQVPLRMAAATDQLEYPGLDRFLIKVGPKRDKALA
jgi:hypothetical protein